MLAFSHLVAPVFAGLVVPAGSRSLGLQLEHIVLDISRPLGLQVEFIFTGGSRPLKDSGRAGRH